MSVFPSFSAYEFGVGKKSFHFILNLFLYDQKKTFFKKKEKKTSPFTSFRELKRTCHTLKNEL